MRLIDLELDLDVFAGPFDLLLTLILREEVDLLEVDLAEIVISYVDHLEQQDDSRAADSSSRTTRARPQQARQDAERAASSSGCLARGERGELELEAATEFLVLIAALLELKSRLMLPGEEEGLEQIELEPGEAADELLARLLDAHRYRAAATDLGERLAAQDGYRFRSAALPAWLRSASLRDATAVYDPATIATAIGELLRMPASVDLGHLTAPKVSLAQRLAHLRKLLRTGAFSFEDAVLRANRVTVAVTLFAVLELYKQGELTWHQNEPFGEIRIEAPVGDAAATELAAAG